MRNQEIAVWLAFVYPLSIFVISYFDYLKEAVIIRFDVVESWLGKSC